MLTTMSPTKLLHRFAPLFILAALLLGCQAVHADHHGDKPAEKIKVAILTGQNNHAWFKDTPALVSILDEHKIFETTLLISPDKALPKDQKDQAWKAFEPKFADYDVIVLNYNGDRWPDNIKKEFEAYIAQGGQAFVFHAGNNPFRGWTEYEQMIGLLWRGNKDGKRVYFDKEGNKQTMEPGEGPGAGHGRQHPFVIDTHAPEHPIFKDLPKKWMHAKDELYHGQRGPAENMTILLTAYSDPETKGTGVSELICWTIPYGKGTVMTNVLGHWWRKGGGGESLQCAGYQTIFTRSLEWLATGKVTIPKPDDFPNEETASMRELEIEPLAYIYVPGVPGSDPLAACDHCSPQTEPYRNPFWSQYASMLKPLPDTAEAQR